MMNSKIPIPNKRSTQSSIPLPTKRVFETGAKKLPLNSRETVTSKKPVYVNQTLKSSSKSSKVEEKDEKNIKRLPSKSQDSKKVAQLTAKPSSKLHDAKSCRNLINKSSTVKNISKQAKPAHSRQLSKNIVPRSKPLTGNENLPKRCFSIKSDNDKKGVCSNKLKTAVKPTLQPKITNQTKKSTKTTTTILKEKTNKDPLVHRNVEKIAVVAPTIQTNLGAKSGVDDSEFKDSHYFKSLILNQRQLSPGIMKLFSLSGINNAKMLQPHYRPFQSVGDFVEDVKRLSSKCHRVNGRLVFKSPGMLQDEETAKDCVGKVKNSEKFHQGKENFISTPFLPSKNSSCQKTIGTNIVDEVRRLSEFRKQASPFADGRRWTYNAPPKPSIANMTTAELATEFRRLSEIRRESGAQLIKKATFLGCQYPVEQVNPHKKLLKDLESLTEKKKEKTKKKVTFLIHSPDSPKLATAIAEKSEPSKTTCCQRTIQEIISVKENVGTSIVDEVRRFSDFRKSPLMGGQKWTYHTPAKPSIANMSTTEIAAKIKELSEIRRESGAQLSKKAMFLGCQYSVQNLNPQQNDLETTKRKEIAKKNVAFLIPSPDSLNSTRPVAVKSEAKLSDISEGSSQNSTPELDFGNCKTKTIPISEDTGNKTEETSISITPELNFTTYKFNFDMPTKEFHTTLPFDVSEKSDQPTTDNSSDNQSLPSEVLCDISEDNEKQYSENFNANLGNAKYDFLSSKFSSLQTSDYSTGDVSDIGLASFENVTDSNSDAYSEFSKLKATDCLFPSARKLTAPSNSRTACETEPFCVNTERKVYTPHPVALHSKSNLPPSVSPLFMSRNFTTLSSCAPICTPLVLKSFVPSLEVDWSDIRLKLNFNEKPSLSMKRRESQIILQSISTVQKMTDFLCDQECLILLSQSTEEDTHFRNLEDPIASILNDGDEMHFVPINSP